MKPLTRGSLRIFRLGQVLHVALFGGLYVVMAYLVWRFGLSTVEPTWAKWLLTAICAFVFVIGAGGVTLFPVGYKGLYEKEGQWGSWSLLRFMAMSLALGLVVSVGVRVFAQ